MYWRVVKEQKKILCGLTSSSSFYHLIRSSKYFMNISPQLFWIKLLKCQSPRFAIAPIKDIDPLKLMFQQKLG